MTELVERVHLRVWDLLPWYANGTLEAGEQEIVEGHLAGCPVCRHEAESCRQLRHAMRQAEEALPSPHPVQLERLLARLDEPGLEAVESERQPGRLSGLLAATPRPVRWALAAQLVVLLSLAVMQAQRSTSAPAPARRARPAAEYITLERAAPPPSGPQIRLVFAENATERQIRDLLLRIGGHLAGGPSPLGTYTVQIGDRAAGMDSLDFVLSYLRAQPSVRFAQPVAGSVPEPAPPAATPANGARGAIP
jgi:hypothetical protein